MRRTTPAPLSYVTSYTYDRVGNRLSMTDPRGIVTETRYDLENRPILTRRAGQTLQEVEYDPEGNRRFVTDANGNVTAFEYDERNLVLVESRPLAAITHTSYDDMGDPVSVRDPEGRVTTFTYDLRRRRTAETDNADQTTTYTYDGNGNRTSTTPPEGNTWLYRYDGADRLVEVEDPDGGLTVYGYDGNGNRLSQTDALERTTSFEYDVLNRRTATVLPATATEPAARETYAYDAAGNRTGLTDAKGQTIAWEYDVLDRETLRTYSLPSGPLGPTGDDLQSIATELDPNGNPTQVTETYTGATGTRVTERTYDPFDRLETVTDPHGETISYAYDPNGNRTRLTDPDGKVTHTSFDALNRTIAVTSAAGVTESTYFRDSRLAEVHYPNGSTETTTYDDAGRIATIENRQGTTLVSSFQYEYDGNGNRVRQVEDNGAGPEETTYTFDSLDRLTEASYPEQTVSYTYDAVGNRLTEQATDTSGDSGGTLVTDKLFTYDERDRLLALTDRLAPDESIDYGYDANGNQTARTKAGVTTTFRYSVRNRLTEVREASTLVGSYLYDHQGLRVAKRSGTGQTIRYVYDDQSVLLQTDLAGTTITKYDYGADRLLSLDNVTAGRQYYLFDALGSVVDLTDAAGAIQARYIYDAWGNHRRTAGTSPNPFGFTGHELDDETGLYYAKARYYDPELGLFLTQDPFEGVLDTPPSLHRYLYAYQNPTVYNDPTGQQTEETDKERIAFLQQNGGLLREGEEPPPGTVLTTDSLGVRIVTPVSQIQDKATDQETEEEPGLFDKIVDFFVGGLLDEGEKLVEEGSELDQTLDDGIHRERRHDVEEMAEQQAVRTLGDTNGGLPFVGAAARQTGEVTKQAGRTALEAEESAGKLSIFGFFKHLGERALGRLLKREVREELLEEAVEAEVRQGVRGTAVGARRFVEGELFETAIRTDAGTVRILAETSVSGGTLTLSDLIIYADDGTLVNQVGAREFLVLREQVAREAADAGFDTLRITGVRLPTSSSANPGKTIDRVIDLSRLK